MLPRTAQLSPCPSAPTRLSPCPRSTLPAPLLAPALPTLHQAHTIQAPAAHHARSKFGSLWGRKLQERSPKPIPALRQLSCCRPLLITHEIAARHQGGLGCSRTQTHREHPAGSGHRSSSCPVGGQGCSASSEAAKSRAPGGCRDAAGARAAAGHPGSPVPRRGHRPTLGSLLALPPVSRALTGCAVPGDSVLTGALSVMNN